MGFYLFIPSTSCFSVRLFTVLTSTCACTCKVHCLCCTLDDKIVNFYMYKLLVNYCHLLHYHSVQDPIGLTVHLSEVLPLFPLLSKAFPHEYMVAAGKSSGLAYTVKFDAWKEWFIGLYTVYILCCSEKPCRVSYVYRSRRPPPTSSWPFEP